MYTTDISVMYTTDINVMYTTDINVMYTTDLKGRCAFWCILSIYDCLVTGVPGKPRELMCSVNVQTIKSASTWHFHPSHAFFQCKTPSTI